MVSEPSGANETRSYSCNFCNKTFKTFKLLADHKSRSLHNHFYCRRCNLDFSTAMERQQVCHTRDLTMKKPESNKAARFFKHFDSPIATVGFEPNGQVRCEPCKRYFSSMTVLSTHLHCYHKYLCTECLLDFHNPGALNVCSLSHCSWTGRYTDVLLSNIGHPSISLPINLFLPPNQLRSTVFSHLPPILLRHQQRLTDNSLQPRLQRRFRRRSVPPLTRAQPRISSWNKRAMRLPWMVYNPLLQWQLPTDHATRFGAEFAGAHSPRRTPYAR